MTTALILKCNIQIAGIICQWGFLTLQKIPESAQLWRNLSWF